MPFDAVNAATMLISGIALGLSFRQYRFARATADRPVLVFALKSGASWRLENVGTGPAINLVVADRDAAGQSKKVVNCAPVSAGGLIEVAWLNASHELVAMYTDFHDRKYTTVCSNNKNRILQEIIEGAWNVDREQWMEDAIYAGREEARITEADLEGLSATQLEVMRNAYYARHGYIFARPDLDAYFRRQSWYKPLQPDRYKVRRQFSAGEVADTHTILGFQNRRGLRADRPIPELLDSNFELALPLEEPTATK